MTFIVGKDSMTEWPLTSVFLVELIWIFGVVDLF